MSGNSYQRLNLYAGKDAHQDILEHGLTPERIGLLIGASGGPKWLVLSRLDQYLSEHFFSRAEQSVELIGTSIGAWRMACYARKDPLKAFRDFEALYTHQRYSTPIPPQEITAFVQRVLGELFTGANAHEIVANPQRHLHVVAVRTRNWLNGRSRLAQGLGLGLAASGNLISRKWVELLYPKVMISQPGKHGPYYSKPEQVALTPQNLPEALSASGAIPLVMEPSRLQGGLNRWHWDGGIVDYHFSGPFKLPKGIAFYPHFSPRLIPGWFDKALPWRKVNAEAYRNVAVLCPSREFIAQLPYGKIPDRKDFVEMDDASREQYWQQVLDATMYLVEDLDRALQNDGGRSLLSPLESML